MTLPASGPLSLSQIAAEFGVALPCVFPDAFYGKAGLPASGPLTFSQFHGLSNAAFFQDDSLQVGNFAASVVITCTAPAQWTYSGGSPRSHASVVNGGTSTSITFDLTGGVADGASYAVHGNAGGLQQDFYVYLQVNGRPGGPIE